MTSDLKPVLTVVLNLLERLADKAPDASIPAPEPGRTPPPADIQDIPAFLKQPGGTLGLARAGQCLHHAPQGHGPK